jgi:hypothetical protein
MARRRFRRATEAYPPECVGGEFSDVRLMWIGESQSTQFLELRFRGLLTGAASESELMLVKSISLSRS